ncbi:hypothetical protein ACYJ1Y_14280 [Natrialbaceae archaeon A-gly3]
MSEENTGDTDRSAFRLSECLVLMGDKLNDALYAANRYQNLGYDHQRERALEELEELREFADEVLERERETETEQNGGDRR